MANSRSPEELTALRRIAIRGALLLLPFLALQLIDFFVLPVDFFTYRIWEAALASPYRYPGGFYPELHLRKPDEFGDKYRTGVRESKSVEWFTDKYGFRNRPKIEAERKYDFVILGDSNVAGSFLDQKDTISEALIARTRKTAYAYHMGYEHVSYFFADPRMKNKAIDLVVMESRVSDWTHTGSSLQNFRKGAADSIELVDVSQKFDQIYAPDRWPRFEMLHSRLLKQPMLNKVKAAIAATWTITPVAKAVAAGERATGDTFLNRRIAPAPLDGPVKTLSNTDSQYYFYLATHAVHREASRRGIDFIMLILPLPKEYGVSHLDPVIRQLRSEGIKVLAYEPSELWPVSGVEDEWFWQRADSHWTEAAVRLIADEIASMKAAQRVANRPFSKQMTIDYAKGFPARPD